MYYSDIEKITLLYQNILENWYVDEKDSDDYTPLSNITNDSIFQAEEKKLTELYSEFYTLTTEEDEEGFLYKYFEPVSEEQIKLFAEVENIYSEFEEVKEKYRGVKRRLLSKLEQIEI